MEHARPPWYVNAAMKSSALPLLVTLLPLALAAAAVGCQQTPPPGAVQYEIMVRYQTTGRLKSRMRQVALDVVSRLKLVKGQ